MFMVKEEVRKKLSIIESFLMKIVILIGAEHEDFPTIDNDFDILITFDFSEIRVNTCGLCLLRLGILSQFIL